MRKYICKNQSTINSLYTGLITCRFQVTSHLLLKSESSLYIRIWWNESFMLYNYLQRVLYSIARHQHKFVSQAIECELSRPHVLCLVPAVTHYVDYSVEPARPVLSSSIVTHCIDYGAMDVCGDSSPGKIKTMSNRVVSNCGRVHSIVCLNLRMNRPRRLANEIVMYHVHDEKNIHHHHHHHNHHHHHHEHDISAKPRKVLKL